MKPGKYVRNGWHRRKAKLAMKRIWSARRRSAAMKAAWARKRKTDVYQVDELSTSLKARFADERVECAIARIDELSKPEFDRVFAHVVTTAVKQLAVKP